MFAPQTLLERVKAIYTNKPAQPAYMIRPTVGLNSLFSPFFFQPQCFSFTSTFKNTLEQLGDWRRQRSSLCYGTWEDKPLSELFVFFSTTAHIHEDETG